MIDIACRSLMCLLRVVVCCSIFQHGGLLVANESPGRSTLTERVHLSPKRQQQRVFHKATRRIKASRPDSLV